jgi:hypothetical protein
VAVHECFVQQVRSLGGLRKTVTKLWWVLAVDCVSTRIVESIIGPMSFRRCVFPAIVANLVSV